jgi:hypothetical protein
MIVKAAHVFMSLDTVFTQEVRAVATTSNGVFVIVTARAKNLTALNVYHVHDGHDDMVNGQVKNTFRAQKLGALMAYWTEQLSVFSDKSLLIVGTAYFLFQTVATERVETGK